MWVRRYHRQLLPTNARRSRRVYLVGVGASGLLATDMAQTLTRIGMCCGARTSEDDGLVRASLLRAGDVTVTFSHSGETTAAIKPCAGPPTRA
ncbi:SIS domain-containing protein [Nocardia sp. R16R-3T]